MNDPNEEEDFCFYGTPVATIDDGIWNISHFRNN